MRAQRIGCTRKKAVDTERLLAPFRRGVHSTRKALWVGAAVILALPALVLASDSYVELSPPCRIVDTRPGGIQPGIVTSSTNRDFQITGSVSGSTCAIPNTARAVSLNLTVVGPTQGGFVSLFPSSASFPGISTINFQTGEPALANGAIVALKFAGGAAVEPSLRGVYGVGSGSATTHLVIDVTGYFIDASVTSTAYVALLRSLPAATGTGPILYGAISGISDPDANLNRVLLIAPPGCTVSRLRVVESIIGQPGLRTYRLLGLTAGGGQTELLFCGTATIGNCGNSTSLSIPQGSERLVIESSSFGTVPATHAYVGFDLACKVVP